MGMSCPKGNDRGDLAERGLIGKVTISSNWSEDEVKEEITSVFKDVLKLEPSAQLSFTYFRVSMSWRLVL